MARILVIDDEPLVAASLQRVLQGAGHLVVVAADGREGIRAIRDQPADLVITDILMPEQEGLETIQALKRDYPTTKIIAITGGARCGNVDLLAMARSFGADQALHKPLDRSRLLTTVEGCLDDSLPVNASELSRRK